MNNTMNDTINQNQKIFIAGLVSDLIQMEDDIIGFCNQTLMGVNDANYSKHLKNALNFSIGAFICRKYLYGSIDLDTFVKEMLAEDLYDFVVNVPDIPNEIAEKYGLYEDLTNGNDDDEDDDDEEEIIVINLNTADEM